MSTIKLNGTSSGSSIIKAPDSGSTNQTFTLPASSGTLVTTTDAGVAGITSSADATAITINSSEQVGIGKTPVNTLDVNHSGGAIVKLWRDSSSGYLQFDTDGTNSHIKNGGGPIKFKTGGDTVRASVTDNGICFGTDTAAANALDDYEEGTFTLAMYSGLSGSITNTTATYTKIGRNVTVNFYGAIVNATGNSIVRISGMPFAMGNIGIPVIAAYGQRQVIGLYFNNAGYFYYQNTTVGGNNAGQDAAWLDASTNIYFTTTYITT